MLAALCKSNRTGNHVFFHVVKVGFVCNFYTCNISTPLCTTNTSLARGHLHFVLAELLKLEAAPNNGTQGALYHIMKAPKPLSAEPTKIVSESCSYQAARNERLGCTPCKVFACQSVFIKHTLSNWRKCSTYSGLSKNLQSLVRSWKALKSSY